MADIYIRGEWIISLDKERRIIRNGAIAIEDGSIRSIGKYDKLDKNYRYYSDIVIDAQRKIVMPGLINTHVHMVQALLRGCANNVSLIDWLTKRIWPFPAIGSSRLF